MNKDRLIGIVVATTSLAILFVLALNFNVNLY
jgi:hypothetical protein